MARVAPGVARDLWDEIREIEHNPVGRGTLVDDPEFPGLRIDLAVAGFAIFYLIADSGAAILVPAVAPWDYP